MYNPFVAGRLKTHDTSTCCWNKKENKVDLMKQKNQARHLKVNRVLKLQGQSDLRRFA